MSIKTSPPKFTHLISNSCYRCFFSSLLLLLLHRTFVTPVSYLRCRISNVFLAKVSVIILLHSIFVFILDSFHVPSNITKHYTNRLCLIKIDKISTEGRRVSERSNIEVTFPLNVKQIEIYKLKSLFYLVIRVRIFYASGMFALNKCVFEKKKINSTSVFPYTPHRYVCVHVRVNESTVAQYHQFYGQNSRCDHLVVLNTQRNMRLSILVNKNNVG